MSEAASRPYGSNEALLSDAREFIDLLLERRDPHDERLSRAWQAIVARMTATLEAGVFLPWVHVAVLFRLTSTDQQVLWVALFAAIDPAICQRIHAFAGDEETSGQGAVSRAHAAPQAGRVPLKAAHRLLGEIRSHFLPDAPLQHNALLDASEVDLAALSGDFRLSPPLVSYFMAIAAPQITIDDMALPDLIDECPLSEHLVDQAAKRQLMRFVDVCDAGEPVAKSYVLLLEGRDLSAMRSLSAAAFAALGYAVAMLDARLVRQVYEREDARRSTLVTRMRALCRDALLCNQVLALVNAEALSAPTEEGNARDDILDTVLSTILDGHRYLIVLNGPQAGLNKALRSHALSGAMSFRVQIPVPTAQMRREAWLKHARRYEMPLADDLLDQVATGFSFSEEQIAHVVKAASAGRMLNGMPDAANGAVLDACKAEAEAEQPGVATVFRSPYRMADIVVPRPTQEMLGELISQVKYRQRVVDRWGFGEKHAGTRNLSALFCGPSGTGKTMAASIVANELNLSLYRVDLASLLDKYVGETEKNLKRLFDRAADMNVALCFDEAEGLFSKRAQKSDSHDHHANLQVGYLLQRIETYPGLVILATNLRENIDKAFWRRFRLVIDFPFPTPPERKTLWRKAFPAQVPLADDIDFELLAQKAVLPGGSIQMVALSAAFRAAAEDLPVSMRHILAWVEREYEKYGKLFSPDDFQRSL